MSDLVDLVRELAIVCDDCGAAGRRKEALVTDSVAYYCHDEEKSCFYYVLRNL